MSTSHITAPQYIYVKKVTQSMLNDVTLTIDDTDYPSSELDCSLYRSFLLMYDITEVGTLVNNDRLRISVQFREVNGTWRDYANGPFGALYEEESTTPCNFAVSGDCVGERVRIVDGPFNDFRGTVSEIDMERAKVRVMVNFFGRETPVELDFLQVEKA